MLALALAAAAACAAAYFAFRMSALARRLRSSAETQTRLEKRVRAQHAVSGVLSESLDVKTAFEALLPAIAIPLGWDMGVCWEVADNGLKARHFWIDKPELEWAREAAKLRPLARGESFAGAVWAKERPAWQADFASFPHPLAKEAAARGLKSAMAFPVRAAEDVVAVFVFGSAAHKPVDSAMLQMLQIMGAQIGQFVERSRVEEARGYLASIIDSTSDAIFSVDFAGLVLTWNEGAQKLFGWAPEQIIGRSAAILAPGHDEHALLAHVERVRGGELIQNLETVRRSKDGRPVDVSITISAVRNGGETRGASFIARDITERRRLEYELERARDAALEAARVKSAFLANMSHEIRTPMNAVIGMTDLLLETKLDAQQRDFARTVKEAGEALLGIIDNILDFSKLEAGKIQAESIDFRLDEVVMGVIVLVAYRAKAKGVALTRELGPALPEWVRGDPGRLRQILTNLVGNALKFTEKGEVTVRALPGGNAQDGSPLIRFEVRDTGIGISAKEKDGLFAAFSQADVSTTRKYGGTGLGLAISKDLAELMGGQMGVHSEPGKGSTFWFTARLSPSAEKKSPQAQPPVEAGAPRRPGFRILLVEDNAVNREVALLQLRNLGYEADTAGNGRDALAKLESNRYDVVLMDCQMPELDGFEATRELRKREKKTGRHMPVVAMTANALQGDRERCLKAGMDEYLAKPVRVPELAAILAKYDQALDAAVLAGIKELDPSPEFLAGLFKQFLADAKKHLEEMEAGELEASSHSLKGSSGTIGAKALEAAAARVEKLARAGKKNEAAAAVKELKAELERTEKALREKLA